MNRDQYSCMKSGDTIVCRCRMERSSKSHTISCEHQSKSSSNETDYWTANPCQPWANLFNSSNDTYFGRTDRYSSIGSPIFATETHSGMPLSSHAINRHDVYPAQVRRKNTQQKSNVPRNTPAFMPSYIIIGHPSLRIYKFSLPNNLLHLLQHIVDACQNHAQSLRSGWKTYLYSLTKQDIAVRDIDGLYEVAKPIVSYIKRTIESVYGAHSVRIDRNQPHVLKYSCEDGSGHTGVELHHDKCDLTANIMLSKSGSYSGGGTYFPDAHATVKLELGEFLIHPGNLVHSGVDIQSGTRYLMVLFTHITHIE